MEVLDPLAPRAVIDAEREVAYACGAGTRDVRALIGRVIDEVEGGTVFEEAVETEAQRRVQEAGIIPL